MSEVDSLHKRVLEFLENLLALKVTDAERLRVAQDPSNIFQDDFSNQKPLRVAAVFALLFHLFLFLPIDIYFRELELWLECIRILLQDQVKIKNSLGSFLYEQTKRRPMILPVVMEV